MKIVKFCLLPLLVLVSLPFIVGLFFPKEWNVEVSQEFDAAPEEIHPWIDELKRWPQWATMGAGESQFEFSFEGPEAGVGAVAFSKGSGSRIRWEITASDPQKGVWFDELLEGTTHAKGAITFEARGDTTLVTWLDKGTLGSIPVVRLFHPLMESSLTSAFEANLQTLKQKVESSE